MMVANEKRWFQKEFSRIGKDDCGFSLIEVMIAMGIVAFVIVALIGANIAVQRTGEAAFQRAIAIQDANQVIEQMRTVASVGQFPDNLVVNSIYLNNAVIPGFNNLVGQNVTVTYFDRDANGDPLDDDPLDVTVTVAWQENGVRNVAESLRTLITQ